MLKYVLPAIVTKFGNDPALSSRFPQGCYLSLAPKGTAEPYCVIDPDVDAPDYSTLSAVTVVRLRFKVFGTDYEAVATALTEITDCYDWADDLTFASGELTECKRGAQGVVKEDENAWLGWVDYEVSVTE